jgi:hypothetical protein
LQPKELCYCSHNNPDLLTKTQKNQFSPTKEKDKINPSLEAFFWRAKYYEIVPIVQTDLELENEQFRSQNKTLIAEYENKLTKLKHMVVKKKFQWL